MANQPKSNRQYVGGIEFLDLTNVSDEDAFRINKVLRETPDDVAVQFLQDIDTDLQQLLLGKVVLDPGTKLQESDPGEEEEPVLYQEVRSTPPGQTARQGNIEQPPPPSPLIDGQPRAFAANAVPPPTMHHMAYSVPATIMPGYFTPVHSIYVNTVTANVNLHGGAMQYGVPNVRAYDDQGKVDGEPTIPGFAHGPPPFIGPAFVAPQIYHHHPSPQTVTGAPFMMQTPYYYGQPYPPVVPNVAPPKRHPTPAGGSPKKPAGPPVAPDTKLREKQQEPSLAVTIKTAKDLQFGDVTGVEVRAKEVKPKAPETPVAEVAPVAKIASVAPSASSEVGSLEPDVRENQAVAEFHQPIAILEKPEETPKSAESEKPLEVQKPVFNATEVPRPVAIPAETKKSVQTEAPKPTPEPAAAAASSKSWASLFKSSSAPKQVAKIAPVVQQPPKEEEPQPSFEGDPDMHKLAVHLGNYVLEHEATSLQPRGLLNNGNYCYINAVLQVLVGCPPFYKMIKSIEPIVKTRTSASSSTPVVDSLVNYMTEFVSLPPPLTPNPKAKRATKQVADMNQGQPFEPNSVYSMLQSLRGSAFKEMGRQEDAEELLTVLLNALNDEMIELAKMITKPTAAVNGTPVNQTSITHDDSDEWQLIGPKNKGVITRSATFCRTPVSDLFLGQMRSALQTEKGQSTATLQPFFTLQLDIQNEKVNSVKEALDAFVSKEPLLGYIDPKNKKEIEASRQTTLEALPPVLMLHLKCFLYDKSGGCQKLIKKIDVPLDLEIQKDVLSPSIKTKLSNKQRQYQLFAVVYHDGKEATKGHYVADVHHAGLGLWIRYDDSVVKVVDEKQLLRHSPPRVPYLLLYRRRES